MGALAMARRARILIGHLRYATHGSPEDNINNHPHACDGGWMVHNGIVSNYDTLCREHSLWPVSSCDSEALALLIEKQRGTRLSRCASSVAASTGRCAILGLWPRPDTLVAVRRGNPLHLTRNSDGLWLATVSQGMVNPRLLPDNHAIRFRLADGNISQRSSALADQPGLADDLLLDGIYKGG